MRWTTEPPREPGWYWYKTDRGRSDICWYNGRHVFSDRSERGWILTNNILNWSGPIPEPEEE